MKLIKNLLKSYFISIIILSILLIIYTILIYNKVISPSQLSIKITTYIIGLFIFMLLGIIFSRFYQDKGWLRGLIVSSFIIIIILIFKFINHKVDYLQIIKLISYIFISCFGGIIGINTKQKKEKMQKY